MSRLVVALSALVLLLLPASAGADDVVLRALTGPGEAITFVGPDDRPVTHLDPGTYTVRVQDTSDRRDFTLRGPGALVHSGFEFVGERTATVTFSEGWYRYYDAAFETQFHGQFSVGSPAPPTLTARVTDTAVSFTDADGAPVRRLEPGTYSVAVQDTSQNHNFRLIGPGVEEHTQVFPMAEYTWTVTFADGRYSFFSERRPVGRRGSFVVGSPPPATTAKRLRAVVGPDFTVAMVDANWQPFKVLRPGVYTVEVTDTTDDHNFHLDAPRFERSTSLPFVGTRSWRVTLAPGVYLFRCDPHTIMFGSFTVQAKPKPKKPKRRR